MSSVLRPAPGFISSWLPVRSPLRAWVYLPAPPADCMLSDAGYSLQTSRTALETSAVTQCETDKRARTETSCAFLSGGDRARTGRDTPATPQGHACLSLLQLRHFVQVRSQHFRSFYVVQPDGGEQAIVSAAVQGPGAHPASFLGVPPSWLAGL